MLINSYQLINGCVHEVSNWIRAKRGERQSKTAVVCGLIWRGFEWELRLARKSDQGQERKGQGRVERRFGYDY